MKGVPTIIFLGPDGQERRALRLIGFAPPEALLKLMDQAAPPGASVAQR